jgi:hypothetical protein
MMKTLLTLLFQNWTVQSEPPSALSAPASSRDVLADQEARFRFSRDVASRMSYKLVAHHVGSDTALVKAELIFYISQRF